MDHVRCLRLAGRDEISEIVDDGARAGAMAMGDSGRVRVCCSYRFEILRISTDDAFHVDLAMEVLVYHRFMQLSNIVCQSLMPSLSLNMRYQ
jgi:hypothetical protein